MFCSKQNDDGLQRGHAKHSRRDGKGQDRVKAKSGGGYSEYIVHAREQRSDVYYYYLHSVGSPGPLNGHWVRERELK